MRRRRSAVPRVSLASNAGSSARRAFSIPSSNRCSSRDNGILGSFRIGDSDRRTLRAAPRQPSATDIYPHQRRRKHPAPDGTSPDAPRACGRQCSTAHCSEPEGSAFDDAESRLIVTISGRAARLVPAGGGTSMIIGNLGKGSVMVLAVVLVVLAVLLGLGGWLFTAVKRL